MIGGKVRGSSSPGRAVPPVPGEGLVSPRARRAWEANAPPPLSGGRVVRLSARAGASGALVSGGKP